MTTPSKTVRWGIVSTGAIAKTFATAIGDAEHAELAAVASRTQEQADAFGNDFGVPERFGSYEALFASDACDAVYIATPHTSHARLAILAAEAGKHVFVEKPAAVNRFELDATIEAARQNGVYFAEAFKERRHPVVHKLLELLGNNPIGEVQIIRSHFGFGMGQPVTGEGRLGDPELAGGGVLDVGCYAMNLARLLAGAAAPDPQPFLSPKCVKAVARMAPSGVDQASSAVLEFNTGTLAELSTGIRTPGNIGLTLIGDAGTIVCPDPWANDRQKGGTFTIEVHPRGGEAETFTIDCPVTSFALEAEAASRDILAGRTEPKAPGMTWDDSRSNAEALDRWRAEIGLVYPVETPEGFAGPIHGRPLAKAADAPMTYRRIEGLDKPVSRMVVGCDNQTSFAHAAVMFDAWYECGGNAFDTAHIYHGGIMERLLGQWHESRGVRDELVIIAKGAHTPNNFPDAVNAELPTSLERLRTDYADIYILHRDNPDVPAGEFVDVLNEHADAGRITLFGGSNWTRERIEEANDYARKNGKRPFTVLSNNLSLARMIEPVWKGCVACSEPEWLDWLTRQQMANFAWSSQARGFFRAPDAQALQTSVNSWDHPENRQRRERAFELADRYGVTAINIAAAYVLSQPFPSFALIGPRKLDELHTSLPALGIELSEQERAYLDLRTDQAPGR